METKVMAVDKEGIVPASAPGHARTSAAQAAAELVARHMGMLGFSLTGPEAYAVTVDDVARLASAFDSLPRDPNADDKRRAFASWTMLPSGELRVSAHFNYQQDGNTQNAGPRDLQAMGEQLRNDPLIAAVVGFTIDVGRCFAPELFKQDVRVDVHMVRYEVRGFAVALSSPPFAHFDSETLAHVVLIDRKNVKGGHNYLAVGSLQPNVGFELSRPLEGFMVSSAMSHGVSPLLNGGDGRLGHRDIFIVTLQPLAKSAAGRLYAPAP
jgi:hypothetical protein